MPNRIVALAVVSLIASATCSTASLAAEISVRGSSIFADYIMQPFKGEIERKSGTKLRIAADSAGEGIRALLSGGADITMTAAPLDAIITNLNQTNPGSVDGSDLMPHPIATSKVAFMTHPSNPVRSLTLKQVSNILAGRIGNWKDLGGKDLPIVIITGGSDDETRLLVEQKLLYSSPIAGTVRSVGRGSMAITEAVGDEAGALGIGTAVAVTSKVATITTDQEIAQPLFLVTRGQPSPELVKVIGAAQAASYLADRVRKGKGGETS